MQFSLTEAAGLLQCTPQNVSLALHKGRLKGTKNAKGAWVIEYDDLLRFIQERAQTVPLMARELGYHPEYLRRLLRRQIIQGTKKGQWIISSQPSWPNKRKRR